MLNREEHDELGVCEGQLRGAEQAGLIPEPNVHGALASDLASRVRGFVACVGSRRSAMG